MSYTHAVLILKDGITFWGRAIGALGRTVGEVVFNTALTGYQEILTDPSYTHQLVTLTCPHIGNVGVNAKDEEAQTPRVAGLIIRDFPRLSSNYRQEMTLDDYLKKHHIVAISDIDTRQLTHHLRQFGAQTGCIIASQYKEKLEKELPNALEVAKTFTGLIQQDLASRVSCQKPYLFAVGNQTILPGQGRHVVVYDFGIKRMMLTILAELGCRITVVPATTSPEVVFALNPDGIFLSNGPGDPAACTYAIEYIKVYLKSDLPIFGICLGHQLLALALGATTLKMKFGHHGANHPVKNLRTGIVHITSQNHGFAVDEATLPPNVIPTHRSLFDGTLQGIHHKQKPVFGFQGHPEASPGPHDLYDLFTQFIDYMNNYTAFQKTRILNDAKIY